LAGDQTPFYPFRRDTGTLGDLRGGKRTWVNSSGGALATQRRDAIRLQALAARSALDARRERRDACQPPAAAASQGRAPGLRDGLRGRHRPALE